MKKQDTRSFEREIHPDWYYPISGMRVLILGTYPPHVNKRDYDFYYPNRRNRFWKILAEIANVPLTENSGFAAVAQRKHLMRCLSVGVQNIGRVIERKGKSSLDRDIRITEFQDLLSLIRVNENLRTILLTGYSGSSSTYHSFVRYLDENEIQRSRPKSLSAGETFVIEVGRPILCVVANSTSMAACRSVKYADLVKQFKKALEI